MRKPFLSRILGLIVLYFVIFCVLVVLQFSNKGNFSLSAGAMTIRGHYLKQLTEQEDLQSAEKITGGVKVYYGGLEFDLGENRGKGLMLAVNGENTPVNPESMILTETTARFFLPGGTVLTFNSFDSAGGRELQINAEFAGNASEVTIPIKPRRSSLVRDSGQLGIMYSGSRYVFSSLGQELENGCLILSVDNTFVSYRSRGKQRAFDPADYMLTRAQNYESIIRNWQDSSYVQWSQNASSLQNDDDVAAYLAQALQRGNYMAAVGAIPPGFINSSRQTYKSSAFAGGMTSAYTTFSVAENEKMYRVTNLIRERSLNILREEHILDFLFTRSNVALANEVIAIINNASPEMLVSDYCPGLLEVFYDIRRWRPDASNPIEHLTDQMLVLISESLNLDAEDEAVYASSSDGVSFEYTLRLGKALVYWADTVGNTEWSQIGRSLVLSAIENGPAGRLHNILNPTNNYPRALWITDSGQWAWTVSQSIRASYVGENLNFAITFPLNMTHYIIFNGIRPFLRIQIHGLDWRSDSQFERYDSSGWVYYPEEQILVLKLRQRSTTENIRIIYREEPPPVIEDSEADTGASVE
ncbi:MAG: hypothetical protein LBI28_11655 [Treponema sp.]|jgi:hypothetical protein|nr:hypothetical protein [Treponema sp.]